MKHLTKLSCFLLVNVLCFTSYAQMDKFDYKQKLEGVTEQWHKITVPQELYAKTLADLRDIRIFGLTKDNDTIEAAYVLRLTSEKVKHKEVYFNVLNVSHDDTYHYFTFEVPTQEAINQIKLDFRQTNFDWRVWLEGSQDQKEWFTVVENYRILSIKNEKTDFQFTSVNFRDSKYRFFRFRIESKEKPLLKTASIAQREVKRGRFRKYNTKNIKVEEHKKTKQTEIDIELEQAVPISHINIVVSDTFDYYRPIRLKYLSDSSETEQGWLYHYSTLTRGILNSIQKNEFELNNTTAQKLKLCIDNNDNQPLLIDSIVVKGCLHELIVRFTKPANYYLSYGNTRAVRPNYDIAHFADHIPENIKEIKLGNIERIKKEEKTITEPIFKNKIWLWTIMIVIILLLGWFSIGMMRKVE